MAAALGMRGDARLVPWRSFGVRTTSGAMVGSLARLAGASIALAGPALAEPAESEPGRTGGLGEIIVTAKLRPERIEDLPLSVTVLNTEDLRRAGFRDLRDFAGDFPSLVLEASRGRASPSTLAIRGLAPNTINKQLQSVSVFLDGVFLGGSASVMDPPVIGSIELIRGPQSAQFGRQTYAGAINYRTLDLKPDVLQVEGLATRSGNRGADKPNSEIDLTGTVRVVDGVWLTLQGRARTLGTLATKTNATRTIRIGEERTHSGYTSLLVNPDPALRIRLTAMYQEQRDSTPAFTTMHPHEWIAQGTSLVTVGGILWPNGRLGKVTADMAGCESAAGRPLKCGLDRDQWFASVVAEYRLPSGYQIALRSGWQTEKNWANQDLYFRQSPDPFFGTQPYSRRVSNTAVSATKLANPFFSATWDEFTSYSAELRLSSPTDRRLAWRLGGFFYEESLSNFAATNVRPENPTGRTRGDEDVRNIAVFGDLSFEVTERIRLAAEMRYDIERNVFQPCLTCSTADTGAFNPNRLTETSRQFLPRFTLSFEPMKDSLIYLLYSEGTKPGRWNQTIRTNFKYVEPERNFNFEVGAKSRLLDDRLFLSGAAFLMKVKDQQFSAVSTQTGVPITLFENIGESRIEGFELETLFQVLPSLRLRGGVGYARHRYTTPVSPTDPNLQRIFGGGTFEGKTSIGLPNWTGSVAADYARELGRGLQLLAGIGLQHTGERFADAANLARLAPINRVNANLGLDFGPAVATFFARDLFHNDRAATGSLAATNSCLYFNRPEGGRFSLNPEQRCLAVGVDRGRELGVTLAFRIGTDR